MEKGEGRRTKKSPLAGENPRVVTIAHLRKKKHLEANIFHFGAVIGACRR